MRGRGRPNGSCERVHALRAAGAARCVPGRRRRHRRLHGRAPTITAGLVDGLPGTVAVLGDTAYQNGTPDEFARCYEPTWGRHKARTRPAVGNHEYGTPGRVRLLRTTSARPPASRGKGWYSYDLGAWHVVALNSNCTRGRRLPGRLARRSAGCARTWPQTRRALHARLQAPSPLQLRQPARREPGASSRSGARCRTTAPRSCWPATTTTTSASRPRRATGALDPQRGVRQFVVGTGGAAAAILRHARSRNSEVRDNTTWGVLSPAAARRLVRLAVRGPARQLLHGRRARQPATERPRTSGRLLRPRRQPPEETDSCLKQ